MLGLIEVLKRSVVPVLKERGNSFTGGLLGAWHFLLYTPCLNPYNDLTRWVGEMIVIS